MTELARETVTHIWSKGRIGGDFIFKDSYVSTWSVEIREML